ncbi:PKD domain-containing protein [Candidatus Bipolaricaulota sp. J31]
MSRVTRHALLLFFIGFAALGAIDVGVLQEDLPHWQEVVDKYRAQGGTAELHAYSEAYLYQQLNFLIPWGLSKLDVVEVLEGWLPGVHGKLADLSPWEGELRAAGVAPVAYGGRVIGVRLPWRGDALAAVPARGDPEAAIPFLKLLSGEAPVPTGATKVAPMTVLSIGPITIGKPKTNLPYVDGALELLLEAVKQTMPSGQVAPLAYLPSAAREAISFVAKLVGIPLSAERGEVTLVVKPLRPGVRVAPLGIGKTVQAPSGLQKVTVPLGNLEAAIQQIMARYGGQVMIKVPSRPVPLAATSEGVARIKADAFHAEGYRGAGVKIAVIDVGFAGLSASQARGDLPYSVITRDFTGRGIESDYSHGTAVAEIIHDVAPEAQLYLIKIGDEVDLDNAVSYCISEGIDIINHSLGWYNTNFYDGTGIIGDIVRRATSAGILWVQAAGNDALSHWEGDFTDTDGDGWLDTEITLTASPGDPIMLYFTWDGWPTTADDYDLFLYGPGGTLVASSTKTQAGTEEPTEFISYTAATGGTYTIRIQRASGSPRRLELFSIYQELSPHVASSSLPAPANAAEALAVGAISWDRYTSGPAEPYSSRGPTNDGRTKPDLVAPDNVSTGVTPYYSPFQGTSAAAPHVAGAAALLLSQDPSLDAGTLRSRLLSYCVPMGDPNTYGAGRLELRYTAPTPALAADAGGPYSGMVGVPITFDGRGSTGDIVEYRWDFGDGTTDTGAVVQHAYASPGTYTVRLTVRDRYGRTDSDTTTAAVQPAPTPRGRLSTDKTAYLPGETVRITFTNTGSVTITLPNTAPWAIKDSLGRVVYTPMAAMVVTSVAPGASKTWTWDQRDSSGAQVPPGTYTVELSTADAGTFRATFTIQAVQKPDLVVESLTYQPANPRVGDTLTFYVRVRNVGGVPAERFYVRLHDGAGYQQGYLSALAPGQAHTLTLRLRLTRSPETFTAVADYYDRVDELDETNNTRSVTVTAVAEPLDLGLSLDKSRYSVGETVRIAVTLNRAAYVYLVELDPLGRAVLVFPNAGHPSPRLPAGRSTITVIASEPLGNEALYGFAADAPIPLFPVPIGPGFPVLDTDGTRFLNQVRAWLRTNLPTTSWDEERVEFRVEAAAANRPPTARFTFSPANPRVGDTVRFDAAASSDPDGTIVQYLWDFGDGATGTGRIVTHTYGTAGTYTVRLTVRDDDGATDTETTTITVGGAPGPAPGPFPGMPVLDKAGIYVWGDPQDHWHITVYAPPEWTGSRKFKIIVKARRQLERISVSANAPQPIASATRIRWEGQIRPGEWMDLTFDASNAFILQLNLLLDTDGDGSLQTSPVKARSFVYVGPCKITPPRNPFVIAPAYGQLQLKPSNNFRIGYCVKGEFPEECQLVLWKIRDLEEKAGCR